MPKLLPNVVDMPLGQSCPRGALTTRGLFLSEAFAVSHVFQPRAPRQIGQTVVLAVAIQVPTFSALGTWANERQKNKSVDENQIPPTERDEQMLVALTT